MEQEAPPHPFRNPQEGLALTPHILGLFSPLDHQIQAPPRDTPPPPGQRKRETLLSRKSKALCSSGSLEAFLPQIPIPGLSVFRHPGSAGPPSSVHLPPRYRARFLPSEAQKVPARSRNARPSLLALRDPSHNSHDRETHQVLKVCGEVIGERGPPDFHLPSAPPVWEFWGWGFPNPPWSASSLPLSPAPSPGPQFTPDPRPPLP